MISGDSKKKSKSRKKLSSSNKQLKRSSTKVSAIFLFIFYFPYFLCMIYVCWREVIIIFTYYEEKKARKVSMRKAYRLFCTLISEDRKQQGTTFVT